MAWYARLPTIVAATINTPARAQIHNLENGLRESETTGCSSTCSSEAMVSDSSVSGDPILSLFSERSAP
jgi:hypothetical protein